MRSSAHARRHSGRVVSLCLGALVVTPTLAQVKNNPGYDRPGLGFTPAVLQPGDFTLEQGLPDWNRTEGISVYTADTLLRLGVSRGLELQVGTGWSQRDGSGPSIDGRADTSLAIKFAPATTGEFSWALLGSIEFTDGARAFRAEQHQYLLGASVNWEHSANRASGVYIEAVHGDADSQLLAVNHGWALSSALGMYVELTAQHFENVGHGSMTGAGVTWQATPRVQMDISARHRLGGHTDTWQGGIGFAVYFGD